MEQEPFGVLWLPNGCWLKIPVQPTPEAAKEYILTNKHIRSLGYGGPGSYLVDEKHWDATTKTLKEVHTMCIIISESDLYRPRKARTKSKRPLTPRGKKKPDTQDGIFAAAISGGLFKEDIEEP